MKTYSIALMMRQTKSKILLKWGFDSQSQNMHFQVPLVSVRSARDVNTLSWYVRIS